jgi:4-hydroxy-tetrahydrodipicolinate synthase
MMKRFGRLLTAMVTPFDSAGEIDYSQARKLARLLINSGSDGLVVAGTTGESPTLTHDEKIRLFAAVKEELGDDAAVIAGTGSNNTSDTIKLTREAKKIGVDGCLLVVPYYNKPTQEGLFQHFSMIAEETQLPCIMYNIPSRTGVNMAAETIVRLSHIESIVGVKESSGMIEHTAKVIDEARQGFLVYTGNDNDIIPVLSLGGYGLISVAAHLAGLQIKQMIDTYINGNVDEAAGMFRNFLPLVNALFCVTNPIPVKYAVNYVGFNVGKPRLPLTEPDASARAIIESMIKRYTIDLQVR